MQAVAAPWLVLQLTGSGLALGIDTGLQFLPILLFGAWGGLIADRFDNRRVQLYGQLAFAVPAFALWILDATGVVRVWMVYLLSFLAGCVTAVDMPTRQSFYLEMVGPEDLTNAMSLTTASFTGMRMIGAVIGGILIGLVGTAPVFLINGLSYLAVVGALLAMHVADLHPRERVARASGQIRAGIRYTWREIDLRLPMLTMAVVFLLSFNFMVLLPLFAVRDLSGNAATMGWLWAAWGIGSLAGALYLASRTTRPNPRRLALLAVAVGALSIALAGAPTFPVAWVLLLPLGFATIAFAITGNSTLQLTTAPEFRGRVMALYTLVFLGSTPIGAFLAGWVAQDFDARTGFAAGGLVAVATGVCALTALARRSGSGEPAAVPSRALVDEGSLD